MFYHKKINKNYFSIQAIGSLISKQEKIFDNDYNGLSIFINNQISKIK